MNMQDFERRECLFGLICKRIHMLDILPIRLQQKLIIYGLFCYQVNRTFFSLYKKRNCLTRSLLQYQGVFAHDKASSRHQSSATLVSIVLVPSLSHTHQRQNTDELQLHCFNCGMVSVYLLDHILSPNKCKNINLPSCLYFYKH